VWGPSTPSVGSVVIFWCHAGGSSSLNLGRQGYKQEFTAVIALLLRLEVRFAHLNFLARMGVGYVTGWCGAEFSSFKNAKTTSLYSA
jgi:hypothetical protein